MKRIIVVAALALAGCAGTPISEFTHKDLQNAAKIAVTPERAAVWKALDAQVAALEAANAAIAAQAKACLEALKKVAPAGGADVFGAATAIERLAGAVVSDAAKSVEANCKPIPLVKLP